MSTEKIENLIIKRMHANLIIRSVNRYFGVETKKDTRKRVIVYPRQVAMYFIDKYSELSLEENGKLFKRDHSTVIHAKKEIGNLSSYDKSVIKHLEDLEKFVIKNIDEMRNNDEQINLRCEINELLQLKTKEELTNFITLLQKTA